MKNILTAGFLAFFLTVAGLLRAGAPSQTTFTYTDTDTEIIVKIAYERDQAPQVEKFIDSCLQPEIVFGEMHKVDKEVAIGSSQLKYHIEASPGKLNMTANKSSNSKSSLKNLKSIFEGLKGVIKSR